MRTAVIALVALLGLTTAAGADRRFRPVPGGGPLTMRVVGFDGDGELTVEVANPGARAADFVGPGLYFVPDGPAATAPARLTVLESTDGYDRDRGEAIAPGARATIALTVVGLDAARAQPTDATGFRVARTRVPRRLARRLAHAAAAAFDDAQSHRRDECDPPIAGTAEIQTAVWRVRARDHHRLDGDRR